MKKKGWKYISNARKEHYFNDSLTSLCGRWLVFSIDNLRDYNLLSPCKTCMKKRLELENAKGNIDINRGF